MGNALDVSVEGSVDGWGLGSRNSLIQFSKALASEKQIIPLALTIKEHHATDRHEMSPKTISSTSSADFPRMSTMRIANVTIILLFTASILDGPCLIQCF